MAEFRFFYERSEGKNKSTRAFCTPQLRCEIATPFPRKARTRLYTLVGYDNAFLLLTQLN